MSKWITFGKYATAYEFQVGRLWCGWVHLKGGSYYTWWAFWRRPFIRWVDEM